MEKGTVSVIIPVYNGERYLRAAIDSVLGQTYKNIECILVDDGSTDRSAGIIRSYGPRLTLLRQPNSGVAHARNTGIAAARGDYIALLDQDDWWVPTKIEKQVDLFVADHELGLVHTDVAHYDHPSSSFIGRFNPNRTDLLTGYCFDRLLLGNAIFNSSVMMRRSVLDEVGVFDVEIGGNTIQDYDLWLRIARRRPLAYIPEKLTIYRLHPAQGMWNVRQSLTEEWRLLVRLLGDPIGSTSEPMRARVAIHLDQLGVAHLDARDPRLARQYFFRSLRTRWSWRAAALLMLSCLPPSLIVGLRGARSKWRTLRGIRVATGMPAWVGSLGGDPSTDPSG